MPEQPGWRFDGTILDFLELVQWVLVLRKLCTDGVESYSEIISCRDRVQQTADNMGITKEALIREMLRIGRDAESMIGRLK